MKRLNRIIAVILSIALIAGFFALPASAADNTYSGDEYVARMYVTQKGRNANLSGHTWIYIENLSNHNIQVGLYTVAPNKGVSVGTYGYSISSGRGLYYNVEAYRYNKLGINDYIYLSKDITQSQLENVSNKIIISDYWAYILNCAFFAFTTWNVVPGYPLVYLLFPFMAMLEIMMYPSHGVGFPMYYPRLSEVFKQDGFGKNAYLVNVDPNS